VSVENRIYAIDLLNRAGIHLTPHDIARVAAVLPLIERDVIETIAVPVDGVFFTAQAICRARIAEGRHRPSGAIEPPVTLQSPLPGQPAAAPASNPAEGGGSFGDLT